MADTTVLINGRQLLVKDNGDGTVTLYTSPTSSSGGGTEFAEDAQHTSGDKGTLVLAVRTDTQAALAETAGDYIPLTTNSLGALYTLLTAGENHSGQVGGHTNRTSAEFTRTTGTSAYIAYDVVLPAAGGLIEMPLCGRVNGGSGYITEVRMITNVKSSVMSWRLHLYNASDPTVSADNAQHKEMYADCAKRLGFIDLPAMTTAADTTNSDMSRCISDGSLRKPFVCAAASRSLWVEPEVLVGFTPADSQKFTIVFKLEQN